jgi:hypothetical protein
MSPPLAVHDDAQSYANRGGRAMGGNVLEWINGADVIRYAVRCTGQPIGSIDLSEPPHRMSALVQ